MPCRLYRVSGRVQGVFFRASTQEMARELGLTGWVRNTDEGQVELVACGEEAVLDRLEIWLKQGPPHARVSGVTSVDAGLQVFRDFAIRY